MESRPSPPDRRLDPRASHPSARFAQRLRQRRAGGRAQRRGERLERGLPRRAALEDEPDQARRAVANDPQARDSGARTAPVGVGEEGRERRPLSGRRRDGATSRGSSRGRRRRAPSSPPRCRAPASDRADNGPRPAGEGCSDRSPRRRSRRARAFRHDRRRRGRKVRRKARSTSAWPLAGRSRSPPRRGRRRAGGREAGRSGPPPDRGACAAAPRRAPAARSAAGKARRS